MNNNKLAKELLKLAQLISSMDDSKAIKSINNALSELRSIKHGDLEEAADNEVNKVISKLEEIKKNNLA